MRPGKIQSNAIFVTNEGAGAGGGYGGDDKFSNTFNSSSLPTR